MARVIKRAPPILRLKPVTAEGCFFWPLPIFIFSTGRVYWKDALPWTEPTSWRLWLALIGRTCGTLKSIFFKFKSRTSEPDLWSSVTFLSLCCFSSFFFHPHFTSLWVLLKFQCHMPLPPPGTQTFFVLRLVEVCVCVCVCLGVGVELE